MKFPVEKIAEVTSELYERVDDLLDIASKERESKFSYDVIVSSVDKKMGILKQHNQQCHAYLRSKVKDNFETVRDGIARPVAVVNFVPVFSRSMYDFFKNEDQYLEYIDFLLNHSPYRDAYINKDPEQAYEKGILTRTDIKPHDLLRACTLVRSTYEQCGGRMFREYRSIENPIHRSVMSYYSGMPQGTPGTGWSAAHDPYGVQGRFSIPKIRKVLDIYDKYRVPTGINKGSYSDECTYTAGFSAGLLRDIPASGMGADILERIPEEFRANAYGTSRRRMSRDQYIQFYKDLYDLTQTQEGGAE